MARPKAWDQRETAMMAGAHPIPCARASNTDGHGHTKWYGDEKTSRLGRGKQGSGRGSGHLHERAGRRDEQLTLHKRHGEWHLDRHAWRNTGGQGAGSTTTRPHHGTAVKGHADGAEKHPQDQHKADDDAPTCHAPFLSISGMPTQRISDHSCAAAFHHVRMPFWSNSCHYNTNALCTHLRKRLLKLHDRAYMLL